MYRSLVIATAVAEFILAAASRLVNIAVSVASHTDNKALTLRLQNNSAKLAAAVRTAKQAQAALDAQTKAHYEERVAAVAAHPYV